MIKFQYNFVSRREELEIPDIQFRTIVLEGDMSLQTNARKIGQYKRSQLVINSNAFVLRKKLFSILFWCSLGERLVAELEVLHS